MRHVADSEGLDAALANGVTVSATVCFAALCVGMWDRGLCAHFAPVAIAGAVWCLLTYMIMEDTQK